MTRFLFKYIISLQKLKRWLLLLNYFFMWYMQYQCENNCIPWSNTVYLIKIPKRKYKIAYELPTNLLIKIWCDSTHNWGWNGFDFLNIFWVCHLSQQVSYVEPKHGHSWQACSYKLNDKVILTLKSWNSGEEYINPDLVLLLTYKL